MLWLTLMLAALAGDGPPAGGIALTDLTGGLPRCDARPSPQADLDLYAACIGTVCTGSTLEEIAEVVGVEPSCHPEDALGQHCDVGEDLTVVRDKQGVVYTLILSDDTGPRTAEGFGIGTSLTCFIDAYADNAVSVSVDVREGRLHWTSIHFREPRLIVTVDESGRAKRLLISRFSMKNLRRGAHSP